MIERKYAEAEAALDYLLGLFISGAASGGISGTIILAVRRQIISSCT